MPRRRRHRRRLRYYRLLGFRWSLRELPTLAVFTVTLRDSKSQYAPGCSKPQSTLHACCANVWLTFRTADLRLWQKPHPLRAHPARNRPPINPAAQFHPGFRLAEVDGKAGAEQSAFAWPHLHLGEHRRRWPDRLQTFARQLVTLANTEPRKR